MFAEISTRQLIGGLVILIAAVALFSRRKQREGKGTPPLLIPPSRRSVSPTSAHFLGTAILFTLLIIAGTLTPFEPKFIPLGNAVSRFKLIATSGVVVVHLVDWMTNIIAFIPVGLFWTAVFTVDRSSERRRLLSVVTVTAGCFAVSLAIEFAQLWFPPRVSSLNDIIAATFGGMLGSFFWLAFGQEATSRVRPFMNKLRARQPIDWFLQAWMLGLLFHLLRPFDFTIHPVDLYHKLKSGWVVFIPFSGWRWDGETLATAVSEALLFIPVGALACIAGTSPERPFRTFVRTVFLGATIVFGTELCQFFVESRVSDITDVIIGTAGVAVGGILMMTWGPRWSWLSPLPANSQRTLALRWTGVTGAGCLAIAAVTIWPWFQQRTIGSGFDAVIKATRSVMGEPVPPEFASIAELPPDEAPPVNAAIPCVSPVLLPPVTRTVRVANGAQLHHALWQAKPGDEILLEPGKTYKFQKRFDVPPKLQLTIRCEDSQNPAILDAEHKSEGLLIIDPREMLIENVIIQNGSSNGINIFNKGSFDEESARDVTLRNVQVLNTGDGRNQDAVKLSGIRRFHVVGATIQNWGNKGSGIDMVGCHGGLIEGSYFSNPNARLGSGVRAKGGSSNIVVRANRFVRAGERPIQFGGATSLGVFRPSPPGNVEASHCVAEGNVILNCKTGVLLSNFDGTVVFRNNFLYRPTHWAFRIVKENSSPEFLNTRGGIVTDNVIVWQQGDMAETAVNVGPNTHPETFLFARNQWYNETSPGRSIPDLPAKEFHGSYGSSPNMDPYGLSVWKFRWGLWIVNTTDRDDVYPVGDPNQFELAVPDESATLQLGNTNPLQGGWGNQSLELSEVKVPRRSYLILIQKND